MQQLTNTPPVNNRVRLRNQNYVFVACRYSWYKKQPDTSRILSSFQLCVFLSEIPKKKCSVSQVYSKRRNLKEYITGLFELQHLICWCAGILWSVQMDADVGHPYYQVMHFSMYAWQYRTPNPFTLFRMSILLLSYW